VPENNASRKLRSYADESAMWRAAGHWARELLQREPTARIAVIAPDLDADAVSISRKVREGFAPGWQTAGERYRNAVDVSYGMPLSAYPAIAVAGMCLRFAASGLSSTDVSTLMRSAFLGGGDHHARCRLDLQLRAMPDRHWHPDNLLAALPRPKNPDRGVDFQFVLSELAALQQRRNDRQFPAAWAKKIDEVLIKIGWPGVEQPDSATFQLQNRWRQLLNELSQLGAVGTRMSLAECVGRLLQIAGETVYQPESQGGGLRVLGMLEAVGLEFDHLWLGAMDASRWPAAGNPLALVNRQLQRDRGMPDASPLDTLQFSQRILQRILGATGSAEICWARLEDDKALIPSPLLEVGQAEMHVDKGDPQWHAALQLGAATTVIPDDDAPPVQVGELVSGGAYTLQAMREEPFKAFCKGRLHARELDLLQPGLNARMRGVIVHGALHHLLRELPTLAQMRRWDDTERNERIDGAAWFPLAPLWSQADPVLRRLLQLEKRRLIPLLDAFLQAECQRDDFEIAGVESQAKLAYGPVELRLRIDRLDRLSDGALLITDYKASDAKSFLDTKRGTPKQLQLSVYARALENDSVGGLQLIYLSSREITYRGEGGSIPLGKADAGNWSELLETWCAEVDVLLQRFAAGETGLNAVQEIKNARPLALLSRFAELSNAD
ncbi:MAG: PD-(D/E)XK nuclease family protein, partial [Woeseia sp.]|nr:PD-(D/E)XK nuclease family protein [Woeseia sp.]